MVEVNALAIIFLVAGISGGSLAAFIGYQTDPKNKLNGRKFLNALLTGLVSGFGLGMAQIIVLQALNVANVPDLVAIIMTGEIVAGALGIDFLRNRAGDAITMNTRTELATLREEFSRLSVRHAEPETAIVEQPSTPPAGST